MGRKRKEQVAEAPAEPEIRVVEDETEPEEEASEGGKVKKADMVRDALSQGITKPKEAVEYIREKYGVEISTPMFGSYKNQEKKRAGGGEAAAPASRSEGAAAGLSLEAARSVKNYIDSHSAEALVEALELVQRFGAGGVKSCIEFIALFQK